MIGPFTLVMSSTINGYEGTGRCILLYIIFLSIKFEINTKVKRIEIAIKWKNTKRSNYE